MSESGSPTAMGEELGSYRSLSTMAVLSFILGLLSILSFAPWPFFVFLFPPAAVILGLLALRQINLAPEVFTGLRLAKLGVGLAVSCAIVSVVVKYLDTNRIATHGRIVADRFVSKLKSGDIEGAFWLKIPREGRGMYLTKSIDDVPMDVQRQYADFYAEVGPVTGSLSSGEGTMEFDSVEEAITERGTEYAAVVYKYRSPKEDTHVLVVAVSYYIPETHERSWCIRECKPGYTPHSFGESKQSTGHSHAH